MAEVLIVLGIIGLIADMTIPTLVQRYRDMVTVTKLKEAHSIFSQSFKLAIAEYGTIENWSLSNLKSFTDEDGKTHFDSAENQKSSEILYQNLSEFLKIIKTCKPNDNTCFKVKESGNFPVYSGVLANGISFYMFARSGTCTMVTGTIKALQNICADLTVDIDGVNNGPNTWGKDIFRFSVSNFGLLPRGSSAESHYKFQNCTVKSKDKEVSVHAGETCAAWVIYNGNLDYLYCSGLSWSGKKTCK